VSFKINRSSNNGDLNVPYNQTDGAFRSIPGVSSIQQKNSSFNFLFNEAVWRKSFKSVADSKHGVRQQRKPCHQSSDSFLVRPSHSFSTNAAITVKECQWRASIDWQCNRERARGTPCAQAGTACTVFSLWSATNVAPAKQEWHDFFCYAPQCNLIVNGQTIEKVNSCKYLRIIIDDELKWNLHIENIYKKLMKCTSIFYKLPNQMLKRDLLCIYPFTCFVWCWNICQY